MQLNPNDTPLHDRQRGRRSFIWLVVVFSVFFVGVVTYQVYHVLTTRGEVIGDGERLESYRFDLTNLTVDRKLVVPTGGPRDTQRALVNPKVVSRDEIEKLNENHWRPYVTTKDTVIGVKIGGEARVYPMRIVRWHEVINDVVGGVPIAVTYSPLCDSAVVFDRRLDGQTLTLAYSGLLYNSNLLMYNRIVDAAGKAVIGGESLLSQLKFEFISGPLAGKKLAILPMYVGPWTEWAAREPQTTGMQGVMEERTMKDRYKRDPTAAYFARGELKYPVEPLPPPESGMKLFDRVKAMEALLIAPNNWWAWPADAPLGSLDFGGSASFEYNVGDSAVSAAVEAPMRPQVHACWFAWYAMHGAKTNLLKVKK